MQSTRGTKIGVGLSGGVDSAASAMMLQELGYDVMGFTMILTADGESVAEAGATVAKKLRIPHAVIDLRKQFEQLIISRFVDDYACGLTPSPCVVCNKLFKFGALWDAMAEYGCEKMATGHYAVLKEGPYGTELHRGADFRKDQSYFLAQLTPRQLSRAVFPLADCEKTAIQARMHELGIVSEKQGESQDLCFLPDGDYASYVLARRPDLNRKGVIEDLNGIILGEHNGAFRYTVGQRRGLGLGGGPWFVLKTDTANNKVIVGHREDISCSQLTIRNMNWMIPPRDEMEVLVQIRYLMRPRRAILRDNGKGNGSIDFLEQCDRAPAGQLAVAYVGDQVVASGWIQ